MGSETSQHCRLTQAPSVGELSIVSDHVTICVGLLVPQIRK